MPETGSRAIARLQEDALWIFALLLLIAGTALLFLFYGLADNGCDAALRSDQPIAERHCN